MANVNQPGQPAPKEELTGWKAISKHLGVSQRTARNWEHERALPVRRRGTTAVALRSEIDQWKLDSLMPSTKPVKDGTVPPRPAKGLSLPTLTPNETEHPTGTFGGYFLHVVSASVMYALLFVASMLLEITYQFDRFGGAALKLAPVLFLWILATSLLGSAIQSRMLLRHQSNGLAFSLAVFAISALVQQAALTLFLPATPVTEATFQTLPAKPRI